jgi:ribose 5-phosphate isomerase A
VDRSKLVQRLGRYPLPVEVIPFAMPVVTRRLQALGLGPVLRAGASGVPFATDQGNVILDCHTGSIADPEALAAVLDGVVGLVEHGLFVSLDAEIIVGQASTPAPG